MRSIRLSDPEFEAVVHAALAAFNDRRFADFARRWTLMRFDPNDHRSPRDSDSVA
jgi:hypothetical protein